jgi:cohesin loading factor subunit SCC2
MPTTLTPAERAEYQKVREPIDSRNGSIPSKNQTAYLTNRGSSASVDQRQKADMAVETLQSLLQGIFEAQDQMQPDTSDDVSMESNALFAVRDTGEGPAVVLQDQAQSQLDVAVMRVVVSGRLDDIEVERLARAQRICESSLAVGSGSLRVGEDWNDNDIQQWLVRISSAETGLVAGRTLLRIMTGGSRHKELQSEDYLKAALDAANNVLDGCILPIMEERSSIGEKVKGETSSNPKFAIALEHRKTLQKLVQASVKNLRLLGHLLIKTDVDETAISSIEFMCKSLIFAQTGGSEKDASLGTQTVENMRVAGMDVMAMIFTKYEGQRAFILNELLMSVEQLPSSKQSARQFKLIDAKPIQLVSALLMRLVQASATLSDSLLRSSTDDNDESSEDESSEDDSDSDDSSHDAAKKRKSQKSKKRSRARDLKSVYTPLQEASNKHASYVVGILLQRALSTTKSSDEPFRRLLDIFTEDFLNVLGSGDWPAAETLLRCLVAQMIRMAENQKSPAPSRTLALELLGTIGSGIIDLKAATIDAGRALQDADQISRSLCAMVRRVREGSFDNDALTSFEGPYRIVIEYLHARDLKDPQLRTARGYHLVQWATQACEARDEDRKPINAPMELQNKIRSMIEDMQWLEEHSSFPTPSTGQGKLAAKIVACNSVLCKAFDRIFATVLNSMSSEQPTIRSRSLKSVTALLEKDPTMLDSNPTVLKTIIRCLSDNSSLVRDSALGLIQKCVSLRPALELKLYERVIPRTKDAATPVRKRAMAFLKEVYLRNDNNVVRAAISNAIISRIQDTEDSVADSAKVIIEEIWFSAFRNRNADGDRSVDHLLRLRSHAALIIHTVALGDDVVEVLEALIKILLHKSKQAAENTRICKDFVSVLSDGMIDNADIPGSPSQSSILLALAVFARAGPRMFTAEQLQRLEPYAKNLKTTDDLAVYLSVVTILRHTLPTVSGIKPEFLQNLQGALINSASKLPRVELNAIAPCSWTIATMTDERGPLTRFYIAALMQLYGLRDEVLPDENTGTTSRARRLLNIVGTFGKACDFEHELATFKSRCPNCKSGSVSALLAEVCCWFVSPKKPMLIREAAFHAVCAIGQSNQNIFLREDVTNAISVVFQEANPLLEQVLLSGLEVFFRAGEKQLDEADGPDVANSGTERLGGTYQATQFDTASTSISQRYLPQFLRIALSSFDEVALTAARIVASINTQGIAHPGDSGPTLVALQTCPNPDIAKLAFMSYKEQFQKTETVLEKTLAKSVQKSFEYQQRVARSTTGYTGHPAVSKFHHVWEVLKTGKGKARTKFFANLCASLNFDPGKLKTVGTTTNHLLYVRFCAELVAFLEYNNIGDLLVLLSSLEKTFSGTGTSVAQFIESEVLCIQVPVLSSQQAATSAGAIEAATATAIEPKRLQQLAVSSQILSLMWETRSFLQRLWNLQKFAGKAKHAAKDINRAPNRATNASVLTDNYQSRISEIMAECTTEGEQRAVCSAFVELISVDSDVRVAEEEDDINLDLDVDDFDDGRSEISSTKSPSTGPRGKKRKSIEGGTASPRKRGRPRKSSMTKRMVDEDDELGGWE